MDAQFRDRAAYFPAEDALVVADLHVGRDAASAVELPLGERADLTERLADLLAVFDPAEVVFAGDLLHAFDRVPEGVAETVAALRETVAAADASLVAVRGNHDAMLDSVLGAGVETTDEYRLGGGGEGRPGDAGSEGRPGDIGGEDHPGDAGGEDRPGDTVVLHGHAEPETAGASETETAGDGPTRYVVGHDHPAIEIEGSRHACLLYAPESYRGADVMVLPAFNRLAPGTTVNGMATRDFQSPLVTDADALRPVVWDAEGGETLSFPPLGEFRRLL